MAIYRVQIQDDSLHFSLPLGDAGEWQVACQDVDPYKVTHVCLLQYASNVHLTAYLNTCHAYENG